MMQNGFAGCVHFCSEICHLDPKQPVETRSGPRGLTTVPITCVMRVVASRKRGGQSERHHVDVGHLLHKLRLRIGHFPDRGMPRHVRRVARVSGVRASLQKGDSNSQRTRLPLPSSCHPSPPLELLTRHADFGQHKRAPPRKRRPAHGKT